ELRITVIAAGFDGGAPPVRRHLGALGTVEGAAPTPSAEELEPVDAPVEVDVLPTSLTDSEPTPRRDPAPRTDAIHVHPSWADDDALDAPEFLK
ncbi:MAG: cell division protein FtsZ, partial [Demequina sp.]|nr:cell division protein FtsZ [Demequina sp.]